MIQIDSSVYGTGQILAWPLFYYVFLTIYRPKKSYPLVFLCLISILSNLFLTNSNFLETAILIFLVYSGLKKPKIFLINSIFLCSLLKLITDIIAQAAIVIITNDHLTTNNLSGSLCLILGGFSIRLVLSLGFIALYKRLNLVETWHIQTSTLFSFLFGYLLYVITVFMNIITNFKAYSDLISGVLLFILLQCVFIMIVFLKGNQVQKSDYTRELTKEQLKNLKMYTDQLEHDQIKLRDFEQNYKIIKALSDVNRVLIINYLSKGELCACKILEKFDITQPTLSHHMKILSDCGLVNGRKEGKWIHYSLNMDKVKQFQTFISNLTAG